MVYVNSYGLRVDLTYLFKCRMWRSYVHRKHSLPTFITISDFADVELCTIISTKISRDLTSLQGELFPSGNQIRVRRVGFLHV